MTAQPTVDRRRRHPCPGCGRLLGYDRQWCAECGLRFPAPVAEALTKAERSVASAVEAALRWLRQHPAASSRDLDILALIAQGARDAVVAERLGISAHTVKSHVRRMSARWGCSGRRAELVAMAFRLGYLKIQRREVDG